MEPAIVTAHGAFTYHAHLWPLTGLGEPYIWRDSIHQARAAALPASLERMAAAMGIEQEWRDVETVRAFARPSTPTQYSPRGPSRSMIPYQRMVPIVRHCLTRALVLERCLDQMPEPVPTELRVSQVDRRINDRGVAFDFDLAWAMRQALGRLNGQIADDLAAEGFEVSDLYRVDWLRSVWLPRHGVHLPDLRATTVEEWLASSESAATDPIVARVLQARAHICGITTQKLDAVFSTHTPASDGRLRHLFAYHSAHSGRWGGRGVQPHNLRSRGANVDVDSSISALRQGQPLEGDPYDTIAMLMRACFWNPGGWLGIVDYSKIELCGLAWVANETTLLGCLRDGGDPYQAFAERLGTTRSVGKSAVLGCGYGMGPSGFAKYCTAQGIDLDDATVTAEQVIKEYRAAHPRIVQLWRLAERVVRELARGGVGGIRQLGDSPVSYMRTRDGLALILPSGRIMLYRNIRIVHDVPQYARDMHLNVAPRDLIMYDHPKYGPQETFGGKLVENLVQAMCRDILAAALHRLEENDFPVVLHVHDEIVCEIDTPGRVEAMANVMVRRPEWAYTLPLGCEGWSSRRYSKRPAPGDHTVTVWA